MARFDPFLASVVALAAAASAGCFADPYADEVSAQDRRVMRAMVDIACELGVDHLVISDRPAVPRQSGVHHTDGRNLQFGIDVGRRVAHEARWPPGKICPVVSVVVDSSIGDVLAHDTGSWAKFIARFSGAKSLMKISLPVYSQDGRRAVIYTESTCPYTCGGGFYHELEKAHSRWRITNSTNAWKS